MRSTPLLTLRSCRWRPRLRRSACPPASPRCPPKSRSSRISPRRGHDQGPAGHAGRVDRAHAAEITFREISVTAAGESQKATVMPPPRREQATFREPRPLPAGGAPIAIHDDGILNDDLRGLYLRHANHRRYAVTQREATDARRMFPPFDEPAP